MLDLWYANAVVYCLDVETFRDGNGDGVGDFAGLTASLDHLERLGVNCLWLNPFYPTPNRDNGYDITDFYSVDPRHGTLGDFVAFMHAAQDRGMRVIVDLVVNHTSTDHPWFQASRASKDSPYRDWYVWRDEEPADKSEGIIFPGEQDAVWTQDEATGSWYLHRFYEHQADLNVANPAVREEIQQIMGFWLQLGVAGFRVDAVPFLIEYKGLSDIPDDREDPYLLLDDMHGFMEWRRAEAILLAEANVEYDKAPEFFAEGNRMQLVFDFIGNQATWLAFARNDAAPVADALRRRPVPKARASGRRSSETTTSCRSTSSTTRSARRSTTPSGRRRTCRCTAAACAAGSRRCSRATPSGSVSPSPCCSRCPVPRCCGTATRSGSARTSIWT